jgi:hypothetical protein
MRFDADAETTRIAANLATEAAGEVIWLRTVFRAPPDVARDLVARALERAALEIRSRK